MDNPETDLEKMLPETHHTTALDHSRLDRLFAQLAMVSELINEVPSTFSGPMLVYYDPRDAERKALVQMVGKRLRFGRSSKCELAVPNLREVSRLHFEIVPEEGEWVLLDVDSANGTFLNWSEERTGKRYLRSGDAIAAAGFLFVFIRD